MLNVRKTTSKKTTDTPAASLSESVKIASGVPLPPSRGGAGGSKYPWDILTPGDSFFVPDGKVETFYTLASSASKKHKGERKFTSRKIADGSPWGSQFAGKVGVAVWRTM